MTENPVPQPRKEIKDKLGRTLTDIAILLEYLGQLSDGRLQAHFEDTRHTITEVVPRRRHLPAGRMLIFSTGYL